MRSPWTNPPNFGSGYALVAPGQVQPDPGHVHGDARGEIRQMEIGSGIRFGLNSGPAPGPQRALGGPVRNQRVHHTQGPAANAAVNQGRTRPGQHTVHGSLPRPPAFQQGYGPARPAYATQTGVGFTGYREPQPMGGMFASFASMPPGQARQAPTGPFFPGVRPSPQMHANAFPHFPAQNGVSGMVLRVCLPAMQLHSLVDPRPLLRLPSKIGRPWNPPPSRLNASDLVFLLHLSVTQLLCRMRFHPTPCVPPNFSRPRGSPLVAPLLQPLPPRLAMPILHLQRIILQLPAVTTSLSHRPLPALTSLAGYECTICNVYFDQHALCYDHVVTDHFMHELNHVMREFNEKMRTVSSVIREAQGPDRDDA
ncbi:hypothetical protein AURDEDRAFT_171651 [Auricularia subglabra TFB-10046 SS5]|nr:hypothetical protein AURDEDRAFT_171651 [Auricularia subglabra TFB-10046 SS5]